MISRIRTRKLAKLRAALPQGPKPRDNRFLLRGTIHNALRPGSKSAGCAKGKHYQCHSVSCVCDCGHGIR